MDNPLPLKKEMTERLRDDFLNTLMNIRTQIFRYCTTDEDRHRTTLTVFLALASEMVARSLMTLEEDEITRILGFFNEEILNQIQDINRIISENNIAGCSYSKESP